MLGIISCMSTINEIIIQYKKQLLVMKDRYIKQISSLPKGTLTVKKMGSGEYWYLKYREVRDCHKVILEKYQTNG